MAQSSDCIYGSVYVHTCMFMKNFLYISLYRMKCEELFCKLIYCKINLKLILSEILTTFNYKAACIHIYPYACMSSRMYSYTTGKSSIETVSLL